MAIYVAFHRPYPLLSNDPIYCPIHVGKTLSDTELGFPGDNSGDHISYKNNSFSELTGLYWIWKNTDDPIIGLCHYRRFFFVQKPFFAMRLKKIGEYLVRKRKKRLGVYYTSDRGKSNLILSGKESEEILASYDAIVPIGWRMRYSVWEQYKRRHVEKDMKNMRIIIQEKYPDYTQEFDKTMEKNEFLPYNMFVMKREYFNSYMAWLFDLLFELEKITDVTGYDNYQKRIYGFMSERLLNVWITKNQLKTKKLPVLYFEKLKGI